MELYFHHASEWPKSLALLLSQL